MNTETEYPPSSIQRCEDIISRQCHSAYKHDALAAECRRLKATANDFHLAALFVMVEFLLNQTKPRQ